MQQWCSERVRTKKLSISDQAEVCPDVHSSFVISIGKHCHCCGGDKTEAAISILIWSENTEKVSENKNCDDCIT